MKRFVLGLAAVGLLLASKGDLRGGVIAYYRFEEGAGTTIVDSSGNGNDGTLVGGAIFSTDVPVNPVPGTGASNLHSLLLDGSSGATLIPDSPSLRPTLGITLEAWMRLSAPGTGAIVGRQYSNGTSNSFQIGVRPDLFFGLTDASGAPVTIDTAFIPTAGQWYFVAGTWDGAMMRLYVDGAQVGSSVPFTGPIGYPVSNPLIIGADNDGLGNPSTAFFPGNIDEVRISNTALSPSQFLGAPQTVPEPGTLALLGIGIVGLLGYSSRRRRLSVVSAAC
jgi:concanavalin A-like lectin/glucanase superfamily protein/PEP-CTERM motif-containing protein